MEAASESQELRLLRSAFYSSPGSEAFVPLAEHLCDVGRPEEAEQICRNGLSFMPPTHRGHLVLARALCDRGRLKEAQDELAELAKQRPDDAEVWVQLGAVVARRGDRPRARALLDYAESLGASDAHYRAARAMAAKPASLPSAPPSPPPGLADPAPVVDDRPAPVAGVLFARVGGPQEATVLIARKRPLTWALTLGAALALAAGALLLLQG